MNTFSPELGAYSQACKEVFDLIELSPDNKRTIIDKAYEGERFVPLGQVGLGSSDLLIHTGFKRIGFDPLGRVARELYLGDKLLAHKSDRVASLPTFILPVCLDEEYLSPELGILTEDFTSGGALLLEEPRLRFPQKMWYQRHEIPEGLHMDVFDALEGKVYPEAFAHMTGRIGGQEVMIDFDDVASPDQETLALYNEFASSVTIWFDHI